MEKRFFRSSTSIKFLALLFTAALLVVGIIQYRWFSDSAASEIDRAYRSMFSTVIRTIFREYERYAGLLHHVRELEDETEGTLRGELSNILELYGPEGSTPFLVSAAGYTVDASGSMVILLPGVDEKWERRHSFPEEGEQWDRLERLQPGDMNVFPSAEGSMVLAYRLPGARDRIIILFLDLEGFAEYYLRPALAGALPEYELEWIRGKDLDEDYEKENGMFHVEEYRFHLFRALFGSPYLARKRPVIPVTRFIDWRGVFDEDSPDNWHPPGPMDTGSMSPDHAVYVRIGLPEGQLAGNIEKQLALGWLGSIVLLGGIGAAFMLMLYQTQRIRAVRDREREFVASVTHELRTPLTVIQSAADNLSTGVVPAEKMKKYGPLIKSQTRRLSLMIEEMLIFSGMEGHPGTSCIPERVELPAFFEGLEATLRESAAERNITLQWETGGLPPSCMLDPEALRLIIENLVLNAVNHAYPEGGGTIRITGRLRLPDTLVCVVEDNGRGISPDEQKEVFEPFYRDTVSRETQEKGSGLGLFIARRKAAMAGGGLVLESPYERVGGVRQNGCRFILALPYIPGDEEERGCRGS